MVEFSEDRLHGQGYVVQGMEEVEWTLLSTTLDIIDVSQDSGLTWNNKQRGDSFRAARLDRFYFSDSILARWPNTVCTINRSINISDHYPLILTAKVSKDVVRSGWFHADASFFHYPEVRHDVQTIFRNAFDHCSSPSQAWSLAVSNI